MKRQSLIALSIVSALAFSGVANATVTAANSNVAPGATAQTTVISYTTRTGIQAAGFDVNVVEQQNILIDASVTFQVFDFFAAGFVTCDGTEKTQAGGTIQIGCDPATGVYSIRTTNNTDIPNLTNNIRVLYNVEAAAPAAGTATVEFGPYCTGVQTPATNGCVAYFDATTARDDTPDPPTTSVNGTITVQTATPPDLTFAPASGTIVSGTSFSITPSGGQAGGSASYTCTPPAGVTLNDGDGNGTGNILTGGAAVNVSVTCPAGNPDGALSCTHTGGAGSTASPVNYTVDCPAAPAAVLSSTPANGTTLVCDGAPGAQVQTGVTLQNTGNADMTGVSCVVGGAGFVLTTPPSATIAQGGSSNVTVTCTVPAAGAGTATGTLTCDAANEVPATTLAFPLSSTGQSVPIFVVPDVIPANSLWSKLGLIGLLAALGALAVAFRRHS